MEPTVTLSAACNVIQLIQMGNEILSTVKRMYEDQSPNPNVASTSEALTRMTTDLKDFLQTPQPQKLSAADTELSEIGDKISKVAGAVK
jgi:hypothetical protein